MATNSAVHALLWTSKIWEDKYHPVFTGYVMSEHSLHVFKWKFHSGNHQRKREKWKRNEIEHLLYSTEQITVFDLWKAPLKTA